MIEQLQQRLDKEIVENRYHQRLAAQLMAELRDSHRAYGKLQEHNKATIHHSDQRRIALDIMQKQLIQKEKFIQLIKADPNFNLLTTIFENRDE